MEVNFGKGEVFAGSNLHSCCVYAFALCQNFIDAIGNIFHGDYVFTNMSYYFLLKDRERKGGCNRNGYNYDTRDDS